MPSNDIRKHLSFRTGLPSFVIVKALILSQLILLIILFPGCASFTSRPKPHVLFSETDIENIVQNVKKQESAVSSFYFTGTISINGWVWDTSADILIAGIRNPFMLKIEITHSWGRPLFYFLVKDDKLEVRDFGDKKQYTGKFTAANLSRFLPNLDCSPDMIWAFLRGYPDLPPHTRIYEGNPGTVNIEGRDRVILGTITFSPDEDIKEAASFPPRFLDMKFSAFKKTGDIYYAESTVVEDIKGSKDMTIKRKQIFFNRDIPDELFTLKNRPYFEVVNLDRM